MLDYTRLFCLLTENTKVRPSAYLCLCIKYGGNFTIFCKKAEGLEYDTNMNQI